MLMDPENNSDTSVFLHYHGNETIEDCLSPIKSTGLMHESEDHYLLDMDKINKDNNYNKKCKIKKKFPLGDDSNDAYSENNWSNKLISDWSQEDTINWLMHAALYLGQSYSSIQHSLAVPGKDLILLSKQDFLIYDPIYGDKLYDLLHSQRVNNYLPHFASIHGMTNEDDDKNFNSFCSDADSDNSTDVISRKNCPERCKIQKSKKNQPTQGKLWEFIRDLLRNRETCPSLMCWEDYSQAKFRFVRSDEVARLWGSRKGNTRMTYEKLSRAMRYYYKSKIFLPVLGRRLVYQFGPNAKGWQTDNPNFRR